MSRQFSIVATTLAVTVALLASGCGPKDDQAAAGSTPAPTATATLSGEAAVVSGAKEGTVATVVENPADAPGAETAAPTPTQPPVSAKDTLIQGLTQDTKLDIDTTATPLDLAWVTITSPDKAFTMDVPADWSYTSFLNGVGGQTFGAVSGVLTSKTAQRVFHGTRRDDAATSLDKLTQELAPLDCTPAGVRPYEDDRFTGSSQAYPCANGSSFVASYIDGKGDVSSYHGYLLFKLADAVGVQAMDRAIRSLDVVDTSTTPTK